MAQASPSRPTFEVRLVGPDLSPERLPLRALNEALSAIQDLASGRDPFVVRQVPPEKGISVSRIRSGSAVYSCVARAPQEARANLAQIGKLLASTAAEGIDEDRLITALRPIRVLSEVAKAIDGTIQVALKKAATPLFSIMQDAYQRISGRLLISGETTVVGQLQRVGGATEERCLLRIPGRTRGLYCNVVGKKLARRLGEHLYETIAATGTATWIHRSWRIYRFTVKDFTQPHLGSAREAIEQLRTAGLSAWDTIDNPDEFIQELRS
jgi:hypothetical protein